MSMATSWISHLKANPNPLYPNQGYPKEITDRFGIDLELVLGPKNQRKFFDQLGQKEVEDRLKKVPEKLFISNMRGGKQTLIQTFYELLEELESSKAVWGIDIPLMNIMPMEGVERHAIEKLWINYRSQRTLYARHIVQIIFKFDPWSVFNGIGRLTKSGKKLFVNDAQHRTIACMMFGIRYMAIQYCISDDENVDIDQFCACNVDNLPAEAYDNYRNREQRCQAYIEAGKPPIREDKWMWDIGQWAKRWDIKICRVGDKLAESARGISHMGDIYKARNTGIDNMDAAAAVLIDVYPNDPMKSANLVGMCDLLNQQDEEWIDVDPTGILNPRLQSLADAIRVRFAGNGQDSGTFHNQCKQAINNWYKDKFKTQTNPSGIGPEIKVSHATYRVYEVFGNTKFPLTMPKNENGENYPVLDSFTKGYQKWLKTQLTTV